MVSSEDIAKQVRAYYESHRESWQDRLFSSDFRGKTDEFILDLIEEVLRVVEEARAEKAATRAKREKIKTANIAGRKKYRAPRDKG